MPIYEYEPDDRECLICSGRIEVLQGIGEKPCRYCPVCGLEVRRLVSQASFVSRGSSDPEKAAQKGFTTYRKAESGIYERVAGEGPETLHRDAVERSMTSDSSPVEGQS